MVLRGWFNYYGKHYPSALYTVGLHFNRVLASWMMKKYKKVNSKSRAVDVIERIARRNSNMFVHWERGITSVFV